MQAQDRPPDSPPDAKWMTHAELAEARGISKASAARLIRRHKWRRQADNQQRVRVLVPFDAISEPDIRPDIRQDIREDIQEDDRPDIADVSRIVTAFESAIGASAPRSGGRMRRMHAQRRPLGCCGRRVRA
jgi:hypothetical protein